MEALVTTLRPSARKILVGAFQEERGMVEDKKEACALLQVQET